MAKSKNGPERLMTPEEVYALPASDKRLAQTYDFTGDHLKELSEWFGLNFENNTRVYLRHIANHCCDDRYTFEIQSVWFDDDPVMIIQSGGKDGDSYNHRFITDVDLFEEMLDYLRSITPWNIRHDDVVELDEVCDNLGAFWGHSLLKGAPWGCTSKRQFEEKN